MAALSLEDCVKMQDKLITGYMSEDFQRKIWQAFGGHGANQLEWAKARAETCLTVQATVLPDFGFEGTREGVLNSTKAFTPEINNNPKVVMRNNIMQYLIDPTMQQKVAEGKIIMPPGVLPSRKSCPDPEEWPETSTGKVWIVTGGGDKGGIVVRANKDTNSAQLESRLATGTIIEERERDEDRLSFEKMDGSGPDFGWVSITFKNKPLVEPLWFVPSEADVSNKVAYKVVHERVAQRATPSKDAKMVGAEKKGAIVKGEVVDEGGVQWLKTKAHNPASGQVEDAFMMIDGASVGLGKLLKKL